MSETKFTPGPWEAKSNNPAKEFTWLVYNRAHSQWPIAVEMKEADAHLIAAAPEMYEALIQARGALRLDAMLDENGNPYGTTTVAIDAINKAIAKAEGKA